MDKYQQINLIINILNDAARQLIAGQPIGWGNLMAEAVWQLDALRGALRVEDNAKEADADADDHAE